MRNLMLFVASVKMVLLFVGHVTEDAVGVAVALDDVAEEDAEELFFFFM
jgi:hypothetical protein